MGRSAGRAFLGEKDYVGDAGGVSGIESKFDVGVIGAPVSVDVERPRAVRDAIFRFCWGGPRD